MADEVKKAKLDLVTEEEVDEEEREFVVLAQHAEVIRALAACRTRVLIFVGQSVLPQIVR